MEIKVEKGFGQLFGNFLRQCLLTRLEVWRPIAFSIGNNSNIVSAGDNILEDAEEICCNLSKYCYEINADSNFYKQTLDTKELCINDLDNEKVTVVDADGASIFHALNQQATINIYYRKSKGPCYQNDNRAFLNREGISADNIIIMNTRHSYFDAISINVLPYTELEEIVKVEAKNHSSQSLEDLVSLCCHEIAKVYTGIAENNS